MVKVRLYCLAHAGGAASVFLAWKRLLGGDIDLHPIELSGRGKRNSEPLYSSMDEAVSDVYSKISAGLDEMPYAIIGHSMGTVLAYELVRKFRSHAKSEPVHIFFSGRFAPYLKKSNTRLHTLPDHELIEKFSEIGGLSANILENEELKNYLLPILRSDCMIVETYNQNQPIVKINCGITVLTGDQDSAVLPHEIDSWQECSSKKCEYYSFDDGHFFLYKFKEEITKLIRSRLELQSQPQTID